MNWTKIALCPAVAIGTTFVAVAAAFLAPAGCRRSRHQVETHFRSSSGLWLLDDVAERDRCAWRPTSEKTGKGKGARDARAKHKV